MKIFQTLLAGCWLYMGTVCASVLDCEKAVSSIESAICRDQELSRQDAKLNMLYRDVRPKLTTMARTALAKQQRIWIIKRDRRCVTGELDCLRTQYKERVDQLEALNATAEIGSESLNSITPVMVIGDWKITGISDPMVVERSGTVDIQQSLKNDNLPPLGAKVSLFPGKWCFPDQECRAIGWMVERLARVDLGEAIHHAFGLNPQLKVLTGSSGSKYSYYVFAPRPDGTLWAIFGLCGQNSTNCRNAAEIWTPASPDAAVLIGSRVSVPAH